jgi:hypothetical protein
MTQGVDFRFVRIDVILVEIDLWNADKNVKVLGLLEKNDYTCHEVVRNYMCKHATFQPSSKYRARDTSAGSGTTTVVEGVRKGGLNWRWIQEEGKWVDLSPEVSRAYLESARGQT